MIEKIDGFNARLQKLIEGFLCIASLIMLAVNLAQVIFRYIFHASILWSEELSTYLYVWIILFSLYAACREQSELNTAVLSFKDPKKMQVVETVRELLGLTACLALLAGSIQMIQNALAFPQKTASLKITTAYLYLCMPICFGLLSWVKGVHILHGVLALATKDSGGAQKDLGSAQMGLALAPKDLGSPQKDTGVSSEPPACSEKAQTLSEKSLIKEHGKTLAEEYGKSLAKEHRPSLTAEDDKREGGEL